MTIFYQPVEEKTFTISGLKSNLTADELKAGITIDGNNVTVAESLLDTATEGVSISDGYTLNLNDTKSEDFSDYVLQTLDNGNVAYLNREGNTFCGKEIIYDENNHFNNLKFGGTSSEDIFYAITSLEDLQTLCTVTNGTPDNQNLC